MPFFLHAQKVKTKIEISWEWKELLRWNKKHFLSFLKGFIFFIISSLKQIKNYFFGRWESDFNISFKWYTSEWNLKKLEITGNARNNKVKVEPTLHSSEMKLLKFAYTPLIVNLRHTYVLKPLLVLVIKTSKNA